MGTHSGAYIHTLLVEICSCSRRGTVAVTLVLVQRMNRRERLSTVTALDLLTTVGVHSLVTTQVGELRVRLETDLALERFDARVHVLMLFQAATGEKRLATVWTLVETV